MTLVREVVTDAKTGDTVERMVEMPDVVSHEEAKIADMGRLAAEMRAERDRRLGASDWTMLLDVSLSDQKRTAWVAYRQALRDVTSQPGFPADISWPTSP